MDKLSFFQNLRFHRLPLESGTVKLTLGTLNKHSDFRRPKRSYLFISIRKISFQNEILTIGIRLGKEEEQLVYIWVKCTELWVSCSTNTDETYLSRYAYFTLLELMSNYEYCDFDEFYWPGFFDSNTGKSRYLKVINDGRRMDISLRPEYSFFYKPGQLLINPDKERMEQRPGRYTGNGIDRIIGLESECAIGYCFAATHLKRFQTRHFPFIIPYLGVLSKDKTSVKSFLNFIRNDDDSSSVSYTPPQERLSKICFEMMEIALIQSPKFRSTMTEANGIEQDNLRRRDKIFLLWHEALSLLRYQPFTHYYYTYGMRNVIGKPRKKDLQACSFSLQIPRLCFFLVDKDEFYVLELCFKVGNQTFVPNEFSTAFFISSKNDPMKFYLLDHLTDYEVVSFFEQYKFRLSVLKIHYEEYFKKFVDSLTEVYELKILTV